LLLVAALLLLLLHWNPLPMSWLTGELSVLVVYIVLGSMALKRAQPAGAGAQLSGIPYVLWIRGIGSLDTRTERVSDSVGNGSRPSSFGVALMPEASTRTKTPTVPRVGEALWNLGFRPFYLLAGIFAAVSVALWICQYSGYLPPTYAEGAAQHGSEMLFGYTLAVVTGFLFTAVRNWTNRPTPTGRTLAALAMLWLAGRLLVFTPFSVAAASANAAFALAVAIGIAVPLLRSGNRRNYFFVALLGFLGTVALAVHLRGRVWETSLSLQIGLDVILFLLVVMGGRVIPMFTNNGVPGTRAQRHRPLEWFALASVLLLLAADAVQVSPRVIVVLSLVAAVAHAGRLFLWQTWRTLSTPLVWILHVSYAWIVVHLLLRACVADGLLAAPIAIHALTIGAIGGMTLGMMTRTSKGHTGRVLFADRYDFACFCLVQLAALVRVFGGMSLPGRYRDTVVASGLLWCAAFALFAARYWHVLSKPRLDGKPG